MCPCKGTCDHTTTNPQSEIRERLKWLQSEPSPTYDLGHVGAPGKWRCKSNIPADPSLGELWGDPLLFLRNISLSVRQLEKALLANLPTTTRFANS